MVKRIIGGFNTDIWMCWNGRIATVVQLPVFANIFIVEENVSRILCFVAATFKKLDVLQWARSHDTPWSDEVCPEAANN
jgi:hypothetical protein